MEGNKDFFEKLNGAKRIVDYDDAMHDLVVNRYIELYDRKDPKVRFTDQGWKCYMKLKAIAENLRANDS